ncbi:MAG TPA: DUF262 domain-containing protein [Kiritimatiellia bacterium]|jgi:hypothetical protein|nr:MAG: hypothetical protein BWX54_02207 [Verrucomicrobia bacterium ADurb.Bin018]HOE00087.1 DUF262 domain-containing protein [Kiritimatiellia bacterium]HOE36869.1 DUF262 domain-containing protein [Kiritimatiellia bacterium]HOR74199.1 DUF262 domain-containing protein [Kiritimatiellia bacterium]HPK69203.1 DUF262 domain-containing protein [Kiritimatiellia bacterium]
MNEIHGLAKNIRALLSGCKYEIDYYQREYKWQTKHVAELLNDLTDKFLDSYDSKHDRAKVEGYGHYFLGSIIISDKNGRKFIIDGQQRLTSLTLLLIYILRNLHDAEQKSQLAPLIFSGKYGTKSFNLNVPEREVCMNAIFNGQIPHENGQPESIANIIGRYRDIQEQFSKEVDAEAMPYFADWLIENVHLVEITAHTDEDAYTIFETMNDRGLSLTPTDMLKGYLLANITNDNQRNQAGDTWKKRIAELNALGKEEDADAIKSWLRSQYAETIRERKRGASPQDFDLIGTEFHRWVRDNETRLGLEGSNTFAKFIDRDFSFYTGHYLMIRNAAETLTPGLECIHYNHQNDFTLQYPLLLAPLRIGDSNKDIQRKLRIVAAYIDILITRRIWNFKAIEYSTMQYAMFLVMREIRAKSASELANLLAKRLEDKTSAPPFSNTDNFRLHGMNGRQIHRILARMTDYVETQSGLASRYSEYIQRSGKKGYEVEHIWADHPELHKDEFDHPNDFDEYRNRIGGLLLLPKTFNASYRDMPYKKKRTHYLKQNLLAQSLHENAYERSPRFKRFVNRSGLNFQPMPVFKKAEMDARQQLYLRLAEQIWDPDRLFEEADA